MERRRRASISEKLLTLHSLAVSLVGEKVGGAECLLMLSCLTLGHLATWPEKISHLGMDHRSACALSYDELQLTKLGVCTHSVGVVWV